MSTAPVLILASRSPRRRELLEQLGLRFEVAPAAIDETPLAGEVPRDLALRVALAKARTVASRRPDAIVLAADTVVDVDGISLGKPESPDDAAAMLRTLSGRSHQVHTGVAVALDGRHEALVDSTTVRFRQLSEPGIRWYVATGEPMDKAGAYAVQGAGGVFVAAVAGSPHTVIGLPVHLLPRLFAALGHDLWAMVGPRSSRRGATL